MEERKAFGLNAGDRILCDTVWRVPGSSPVVQLEQTELALRPA
jgi:hypothetical protein